MEDQVGLPDRFVHEGLVEDRLHRDLEATVRLEMGQVAAGAGREIVDDLDLIAGLKQALYQVRPDEARAPGHQGFHRAAALIGRASPSSWERKKAPTSRKPMPSRRHSEATLPCRSVTVRTTSSIASRSTTSPRLVAGPSTRTPWMARCCLPMSSSRN